MGVAIETTYPLNASDIFEVAASRQVLDIEIGRLDLSLPASNLLLNEMANSRQEQYLGIALECSIEPPITPEQASSLQRAGVKLVRLLPSRRGHGTQPTVPVVLSQMEAAKLLHEADIEPVWQFAVSNADSDPDLAALFVSIMGKAHHLPPPTSITQEMSSGSPTIKATMGKTDSMIENLEATLEKWRTSFQRYSLTYARGPGFIRIRDRRGDSNHWTFITLTARQADVFVFCRSARSSEEIETFASEIPRVQMNGFLDNMAARGLISRFGSFHLSLPIRRRVEERWSSDVY